MSDLCHARRMDGPTTPAFGEPGRLTFEELRLAARNHGMPLEALGYRITPTGLHYLLTHYDVPAVDPDTWALEIGGAVTAPMQAHPRRPAGPAPESGDRDDGVRGERPGVHRSASAEPAVAARGRRHGRMVRCAADVAPRRGRDRGRCGRGGLRGARPGGRERRRTDLRALAGDRRGATPRSSSPSR